MSPATELVKICLRSRCGPGSSVLEREMPEPATESPASAPKAEGVASTVDLLISAEHEKPERRSRGVRIAQDPSTPLRAGYAVGGVLGTRSFQVLSRLQ